MRFLVACVVAFMVVEKAIAFPDPALRFAVLDTNHDGKLSEQELIDGWTGQFKLIFKKLDKNEDGSLTIEEFDDDLRRSLGQKGQAFRELLAVFDTNHDGKLGLEEVVEQYKLLFKLEFKRMDTNNDGFIQPEEFDKSIKGQDNPPPKFINPRDAFKYLDTNHDGRLSQGELVNGWIALFEVSFRRLDKNGDRFLARDEFANIEDNLRTILGRNDKTIDEIFFMLDTNFDGKVCFDEVVTQFKRFFLVQFNRMDTNHDGFVTPEEFDKNLRHGDGQEIIVGERDPTQKDSAVSNRDSIISSKHPVAARMFNLIDLNGDNKISLYEAFVGLHPIRLGEKLELIIRFSEMDKNNDYFIQPEEFDRNLAIRP